MHVQTFRRSIYETRRPEHPHSPIRQYERRPQVTASRPRCTSLVDWEVIQIIVTSMNFTVGIIFLNKFPGKSLILLEAIVDLVLSTPNYQVTIPMKMCLNSLIQWFNMEANGKLWRNFTWTYLSPVARCGIRLRTSSSLSLYRFSTPQHQQNTTTGLLFSWTHSISWKSRISRIFIRVKIWTPK